MVLPLPELPVHCEHRLRDGSLPWHERLECARSWLHSTRNHPDFYCRIVLTLLYRELCDREPVPDSETLLQDALASAKRLWNREKRLRWWGSLAVLDGYRSLVVLGDRTRARSAFASVMKWGVPATRSNFVNSVRAAVAAGSFEPVESPEYEKWFLLAGESFRRGVSQIEDLTLKPRQVEVRNALDALWIARIRREENRMPDELAGSPFVMAIRAIVRESLPR